MSAQAGQRIGDRYQLVRRLRAGGFGQVWLAEDSALGVEVAIKEVRLPADLSPGEHAELLARATREARNAARLRHHPNIVSVHDIVEADGAPWIVMQLVPGHSLADELEANGPLEPGRAVEVARALLQALEAAHRAGIIHRDVKPANVMLTPGGDVFLTDFGIAVDHADPRLTPTNIFVGTPGYTAPERWQGKAADGPSDLYSLGATLYEAVEGVLPHPRDNPVAALTEPPRPPERAGVLASLLADLLRREPARRSTPAEALALLASQGSSQSGGTIATVPIASTPTLVEPAGPFEISWTGEEPLSEYAYQRGRTGVRFEVVAVLVLAVLATACYVLAANITSISTFRAGTRAVVLQIFAGIMVVAALGVGHRAATRLHGARLLARRRGWSLRVTPHHLLTTSAAGRRDIPWNAVELISIEEMQFHHVGLDYAGDAAYRYTAVHVRFTPQKADVLARPAGWPYPTTWPWATRPDRLTPVCILGPMTDPQRAQLTDALTRYGGSKWDPA